MSLKTLVARQTHSKGYYVARRVRETKAGAALQRGATTKRGAVNAPPRSWAVDTSLADGRGGRRASTHKRFDILGRGWQASKRSSIDTATVERLGRLD